MPLPGHPVTGPDRESPGTMDDEVETSAQRVRHHLLRSLARWQKLLTNNAESIVPVTDPNETGRISSLIWSGPLFDSSLQSAVGGQGHRVATSQVTDPASRPMAAPPTTSIGQCAPM